MITLGCHIINNEEVELHYVVMLSHIYIGLLLCPPDLRRQGRASRTLQTFIRECDEAGVQMLVLTPPVEGAIPLPSITSFYQKFGFVTAIANNDRYLIKVGDMYRAHQENNRD